MCLMRLLLLKWGGRHCTAMLSVNAFGGGLTGLLAGRAAVEK